MSDNNFESQPRLVDRVDMTPIDLSSLYLSSSSPKETRMDAATAALLPGLNLDNASIKQADVLEPSQCRLDQTKAQSDAVKESLGKFDYSVPGVVVRMPENYDPCKPINLMVYNHGFRSTAKSAIKESDFEDQMKNAPPNTVLIIPEWQATPGSSSSNQGDFKKEDYFDHKVDEVFAKIPALHGRSAQDIANVNIVSHSAGYNPTETEIYHNKLSSKVKSITLLDSLYDNYGFDKWLKDNIHDLSDGSKQFTNIYYGTSANSLAEAHRVEQMLDKEKLSKNNLYIETDHGKRVVKGSELAKHSIVFKYSNATVHNLDPHSSLPGIYMAEVNESTAHNI